MSARGSLRASIMLGMHHPLPSTPEQNLSHSNPYPCTPDSERNDSFEDQDEDEVGERYQYYTIPAQRKKEKPLCNVVNGDYGVFEKKRKKKNILKGLFKRRDTNAWQDDTQYDPRMILKPEPEVVSDDDSPMSATADDGDMGADAELYLADIEPGHKVEHVSRRKHTYIDKRGHLNEVISERILVKSKIGDNGTTRYKTKVETQFPSNEEELRREETMRHRREQAQKMRLYERFFVNGIDTSKQKKKPSKRQKKYSFIGESARDTKDAFRRTTQSMQEFALNDFRNRLISPKAALEFHKSASSCITALPFGNIAKPVLYLLGNLITDPKSKEGSYFATLVAALSTTMLMIYCLGTYKLFRFLWPVLLLLLSIARSFGVLV